MTTNRLDPFIRTSLMQLAVVGPLAAAAAAALKRNRGGYEKRALRSSYIAQLAGTRISGT